MSNISDSVEDIMRDNVALAKSIENIKNVSSNQKTIESDNKEKNHSNWPHYFGYLAEHLITPFPEECILCPKVVECIIAPWPT